MKLRTFRIGGIHPEENKITAEVATKHHYDGVMRMDPSSMTLPGDYDADTSALPAMFYRFN